MNRDTNFANYMKREEKLKKFQIHLKPESQLFACLPQAVKFLCIPIHSTGLNNVHKLIKGIISKYDRPFANYLRG